MSVCKRLKCEMSRHDDLTLLHSNYFLASTVFCHPVTSKSNTKPNEILTRALVKILINADALGPGLDWCPDTYVHMWVSHFRSESLDAMQKGVSEEFPLLIIITLSSHILYSITWLLYTTGLEFSIMFSGLSLWRVFKLTFLTHTGLSW